MQVSLINSLKRCSAMIAALDRADLPLLGWLPAGVKRKIVRRFFNLFAILLARKPQNINGLRFYVPRRLMRYYAIANFEPDVRRLIEECVKPGMVAVDIGANIGCHSLLMARLVGPAGKVYAVEPDPKNLDFLRRNILLNGLNNIEVLPYAAGARQARRNLYLHEAPTMHSLYDQAGNSGRTVAVQEVALDDYIDSPIDFMKIDIEGGEVEALNGMVRILAERSCRHIVAEWNPKALREAGYEPEVLPALLLDAGFSVSAIADGRWPLQSIADARAFLQSPSMRHTGHLNLFAVHLNH